MKKISEIDGGGVKLPVRGEQDLVNVRAWGRKMAATIGFSKNVQTLIATALSEIGRNILQYAGSGEIVLKVDTLEDKKGIVIVASDEGPGIKDVDKALTEGFSTGKGMGIGLTGSKRIMDTFVIQTEKEMGTTVKMSKWLQIKNSNKSECKNPYTDR